MLADQLPIVVIGSGEDCMKTHPNIISSELANLNRTRNKKITTDEIEEVFQTLNDLNIDREFIRNNLIKVGSYFMISHPMGPKVFLKRNMILRDAKLINNSKIDTFFRKIIPFKQKQGSDLLYLLGDNGVLVTLRFDNPTHPELQLFESKFIFKVSLYTTIIGEQYMR